MIKRRILNEKTDKSSKYKFLCNILESNTNHEDFETDYDIFLCHSSIDIDEVLKLKILLEETNKNVYLDKVCDPDLSFDKINAETAKRLQIRLRHSKKLYFVLSKNSKKSSWMPWELGCFNGLDEKKASLIKIYPIIDENEEEIMEFEGQEYLELYELANDISKSHFLTIKIKYLTKKMYEFCVANPEIAKNLDNLGKE